MTVSPLKSLGLLEKQIDSIVKELGKSGGTNTKLEKRAKELEDRISQQKSEIERLGKKAGAFSDDLDEKYRKQREKIHSRLMQVMARLESL